VDGVAATLFVAPTGADCTTVVTATVANSSNRVSSQTDPTSCGRIAEVCAADAGTADGGH